MVIYGFNSKEQLIKSRLEAGADKIFEVCVQIIVETPNGETFFYTLEGGELTRHSNGELTKQPNGGLAYTEAYCLEQLKFMSDNAIARVKKMINEDNVILTEESKLIASNRVKEAQLVLR